MDKQRVRLEFPLGGRNDRFAFQKQPPLTTVAARNVWPDSLGRKRGGSRPGFQRASVFDIGGSILGLGQVSYIPSGTSRITTLLVAVISDAIYTFNETTLESGPINIVTSGSEIISMAERSQKLYIANHSVVQADSASTYKPLIFDPLTAAVSDWASAVTDGTLPLGCNAITLWRDRMVLAGGTTDPYGVFMSRQSDPLDWDYSEEDEGAAVNLSLTTAGQMPDTVTSLTPHHDNCLLIGCPTSLWTLLGDPRSGGQLVNLSSTIGVVDRHAWCTTPDGLFVFLSADGLYAMPAGCPTSGNPISLSREKIPSELLNISRHSTPAGKIASLAYDTRWRGIHIFISDRTSGNEDEGNIHWFFDWEQKSFWEVQFGQAGFDPWNAVHRKNLTSDESVVFCGCRDGVIRRYISTDTLDDSGYSTDFKIQSYVTLGPIVEGPEVAHEIRLDELDLILSQASTNQLTWEIYSGNSVEEAVAAMTAGEPQTAGAAEIGRSGRFFPRVKGAVLFVRLFSREAWSLEAVTATLARLGKVRV